VWQRCAAVDFDRAATAHDKMTPSLSIAKLFIDGCQTTPVDEVARSGSAAKTLSLVSWAGDIPIALGYVSGQSDVLPLLRRAFQNLLAVGAR
jgi:hypothetical protein